MLTQSGWRWYRRGHSVVAWSSIILLEERPRLSLLVPAGVNIVLSNVLDAESERRILLVDESANVSCMCTLKTGVEDNATSLAPT
jgi:hypothetical protein